MNTNDWTHKVMQTPKEPNRINILLSAKEEFLTYGFEKASMRKIAKAANVTTSNIYNYFDSKEDIFEILLSPILDGIRMGIRIVSDKDHLDKRLQLSYDTLKDRFHIVMNYVDKNRDLFRLLILKSSGSNYQNYHEELLQDLTELNMKQLDYYKKSKNLQHIPINSFFVRSLVSFFLNIFIEMIRSNISRSEVEEIEDQLLQFMVSGTRAILLDIKE